MKASNRIIVGLNFPGLDPSACVIVDGEVVAFAEEERFTREKHAEDRLPYEALAACLDIAHNNRTTLVSHLNEELGTEAKLLAGGPETCQRVGIVTGGAGDMIAEAVQAGCDTFITGEGAHHTFFDAHEWGINVIYGGHYATEQLGVQALANKVSERFGLPWSFYDHPTGL